MDPYGVLFHTITRTWKTEVGLNQAKHTCLALADYTFVFPAFSSSLNVPFVKFHFIQSTLIAGPFKAVTDLDFFS